MWIRVYGGKNKELSELIFSCLKVEFPHASLSMSSEEGKLYKINMDGDADEKPLSNYAYSIEKFWIKKYKEWMKSNENPVQPT